MTKQWLENPYRTIIEFCENKAMNGDRVIDTLKDLQKLVTKTENEVAKKRIEEITEAVKLFPAHMVKNYLVQGGIIEQLKDKFNK